MAAAGQSLSQPLSQSLHNKLALLPINANSVTITTPVPGRVTRTRVRTGCIVCKIRRVKCDELKPACKRCTSTGRKCEGYASQVKNGESPSFSGSRSSNADTPITVNPFFDVSGSLAERRSFHYLRVRTEHNVLRYFEHGFWDRLVLQISHREPTVRHALLALSSLCETNDAQSNDEQDLSGHHPQQLSQFAMQQYTTSIRLLTVDLAASQPRLDVTLSCCLVFIWLEFLRNDFDTGLRHLDSGLKILRDFNQPLQPVNFLNSSTQYIDPSLKSLFNRLHIQAIILGSPTSTSVAGISDGQDDAIGGLSAMPSAFSSINEARRYLDIILSSVMLLVRQQNHTKAAQSPETTFSPFSSAARCPLYLHHLNIWQDALSCTPQLPEHGTAFAVLSLYHTMATIILHTLSTPTEMIFDAYHPSFALLLSYASTIIATFTSSPPLFLSMGIIPPLFFTALKCRDLPLRRRAVELLRCAPAREGMWDRDRTAQYAEAKIAIEERGRGGLAETEVLPEGARIFDEELQGVLVQGMRVAHLRYRQRRRGKDGVVVVECKEELTRLGMAMGDMI